MKHNQFKITILFVGFCVSLFAQKTDKQFNEQFYTNDNVEVVINISNADIEVVNWNKSEVSVAASIEVDGVTKEEAQKYIDRWNFEALGNKTKVQIKGNGYSSNSGLNSLVYFNNKQDWIPKIYKMPHVKEGDVLFLQGNTHFDYHDAIDGIGTIYLPDMEEFSFPEVQSDVLFSNIDMLDFDFDKYSQDGGAYFFQWKDDVNDIKISSKKEWDKFKKSKEYQKLKKELEENKEKLLKANKLLEKRSKQRKILQKRRKELVKKRLKKRKEMYKEISKKRKELLKERMVLQARGSRQSQILSGYLDDGLENKKVKIKKKITVKVPVKAILKLNTRHCKVKLPNSKVSGKVSYGTFKAEEINGGSLNIFSSPVTIKKINDCTLFLNNVQNAEIHTISNLNLTSNSSTVKISNVRNNTEVSDKFGNLDIKNIAPNFRNFTIDLNSSVAKIQFVNLKKPLIADFNKDGFSRFPHTKPAMVYRDNSIISKGNFRIYSEDSSINIKGKFSAIEVVK